MLVPMAARGRVLGVMTFIRTGESPAFDRDDLAVAGQLALRAALSLDNAKLYGEAKRVQADLLHVNRRVKFLADAGAEMASSLDFEGALGRLARLSVDGFADWCAIDMLRPDGTARRVTVVHRDPAMIEKAAAVAARYPAREDSPQVVQSVLRSGVSQLFQSIPDEMLSGAAVDDEHLALLREFGIKSAMCVPLSVHGRVMGAITFVVSEGDTCYDTADLGLAEDLGRRAGVAIDNARLYTEAQQRESDLLRANTAKDEFLGMMSHELRTPITVVHGGARVLRTRGAMLDEETREGLLEDIERESDRLARMLENLLALARVELDEEIAVEPVLVQRLLPKLLAGEGRLGGGRVTLAISGELAPVAAEAAYLEHIVRNLISNSIKYSPAETPIEVSLAPHGSDAVAIRVVDRGPGVADDEVGRIFERFYRSDRTARMAGGAGLGLAVCKRLIESMSGTIWARPREGGASKWASACHSMRRNSHECRTTVAGR